MKNKIAMLGLLLMLSLTFVEARSPDLMCEGSCSGGGGVIDIQPVEKVLTESSGRSIFSLTENRSWEFKALGSRRDKIKINDRVHIVELKHVWFGNPKLTISNSDGVVFSGYLGVGKGTLDLDNSKVDYEIKQFRFGKSLTLSQ